MKKYNVPVAVNTWRTSKGLLIYRKGKQKKEDTTECVYEVPCMECDKTYIGKTGRKLGIRPHRTQTVEWKWIPRRAFTRSQRTASLLELNMSAVNDHPTQGNHVIDWAKATVIDREPGRPTRWIKEAVHYLGRVRIQKN